MELVQEAEPAQPSVREFLLAEVQVDSGVLLLADPMYVEDPLTIEDVPRGRHAVRAQMIRYPEGSERMAKIGMRFRPGPIDAQETLGTIDVDSAIVIAVDAGVYESQWKEVGPERLGLTSTPDHHIRVAKLIEKEFGLAWKEVSFLHAHFEEPISEELEARITAYLETLPEFAGRSYMYFRVETMNSMDRIQAAMHRGQWAEVTLDDARGGRLLAVASGFGDGGYDVQGLFGAGELKAIEIEFIGPAQDEILKAFPVLRY